LVTGRNGAGKSTLLRCLAGLLAPDSGAIDYWEDGGPPMDAAGRRRRAGLVAPDVAFYGELTAAETRAFFSLLRGRGRSPGPARPRPGRGAAAAARAARRPARGGALVGHAAAPAMGLGAAPPAAPAAARRALPEPRRGRHGHRPLPPGRASRALS